MPLFEYRCESCQSRLERLVRTRPEGLPAPCPECGGPTVRVLSTFAPRGDRSASATQGVCQHRYGCSCGKK